MMHSKGVSTVEFREGCGKSRCRDPKASRGRGVGRRLPSLSGNFWNFLPGNATFCCVMD